MKSRPFLPLMPHGGRFFPRDGFQTLVSPSMKVSVEEKMSEWKMTPGEHYLKAERLLEEASGPGHNSETIARNVAAAQVHALLALWKP